MLVDNPGKSNQQMLPSELVQSARLLYRQNPADVLVKESVSYQQLSILQRATGATQISSWRFHQCWISRVPHIYSTKKSHMTKRHVTRQVIKGDSALTSCILSQQLLHVYFHSNYFMYTFTWFRLYCRQFSITRSVLRSIYSIPI